MMDSPDLSPGSSPWDTNRTNRTQSSGEKYESALFWAPPKKTYVEPVNVIRFRVLISNLQVTKVFKVNLTHNCLKPKRIDYHLH